MRDDAKDRARVTGNGRAHFDFDALRRRQPIPASGLAVCEVDERDALDGECFEPRAEPGVPAHRLERPAHSHDLGVSQVDVDITLEDHHPARQMGARRDMDARHGDDLAIHADRNRGVATRISVDLVPVSRERVDHAHRRIPARSGAPGPPRGVTAEEETQPVAVQDGDRPSLFDEAQRGNVEAGESRPVAGHALCERARAPPSGDTLGLLDLRRAFAPVRAPEENRQLALDRDTVGTEPARDGGIAHRDAPGQGAQRRGGVDGVLRGIRWRSRGCPLAGLRASHGGEGHQQG